MMEEIRAGSILSSRYQVQKELGRGGMGAVYLALDLQHRRPVAIKVALLADLEARHQFRREAAYLKKLHHHSLPRVWDYFSDTQRDFLVMEYIPGEDLEALVRRKGHQPEWLVLRWVDELLDGLEYLHSQDPPIIHRDVKPSNLKVRQDETLVLVDFGIATELRPDKGIETAVLAITPGFSPPEQYSQEVTDARSDVYSVGATIYFLLTGIMPPAAIERLDGRATLRTPTELRTDVSASTDLLMRQAMNLRREDRWRTATAMRQAATRASQQLVAQPESALVVDYQQPTSDIQPALTGTRASGAKKTSAALLLFLLGIGLVSVGWLTFKPLMSGGTGASQRAHPSQGAADVMLPAVQMTPTPTFTGSPTPAVHQTPTESSLGQPGPVVVSGPVASPDEPPATRTPLPTHTSTPESSTSQAITTATATEVIARVSPAPATPLPLGTALATNRTYAAAALVGPANASAFGGSEAEIVFEWNPLEELGQDDYYVLTITFPHDGQPWKDLQWTKGTSVRIPPYLSSIATLPGTLQWNVVVMRQTGIQADGQRDGFEVGTRSETWQFDWAPSGPQSSTPTRPAPPTRVPAVG